MSSPDGEGHLDRTQPSSVERKNGACGHTYRRTKGGGDGGGVARADPGCRRVRQRRRRMSARKSWAKPAGAVASGQRGEPSGGSSSSRMRESSGKRRRTSASGAAKTSQLATRRNRQRSVKHAQST